MSENKEDTISDYKEDNGEDDPIKALYERYLNELALSNKETLTERKKKPEDAAEIQRIQDDFVERIMLGRSDRDRTSVLKDDAFYNRFISEEEGLSETDGTEADNESDTADDQQTTDPKKKEENKNAYGHRTRMRRRLLKFGARIFSDEELLELLLMTVIPRRDVKQLSRDLLQHFHSFSNLLHASVNELKELKGVGSSVICQIKVVEGICDASLRPTIGRGTILKEWRQILDFCRFCIAHERSECLYLMYLNGRMQIISIEKGYQGTVDRLQIVPNDVLKRSLNLNASAVLLIHNHPSGVAQPSREDILHTNDILNLLKVSGVTLYDHLIVSKEAIYSFNRRGTVG